MKKKSNGPRIIFRLTPEERGEIMQAIKASAEPWRGVSFYVHDAALSWARRLLADQLALELREKNARRAARKRRAS